MNPDLFNLRPIKPPHLDNSTLQRAVSRISQLTEGWEGGTASFEGLLNDFRKQVRAGFRNGRSFEEYTNVRRREWLLLSLYLNDLGADRVFYVFDRPVGISHYHETRENCYGEFRHSCNIYHRNVFIVRDLGCNSFIL
jgi:hypothetical protein